MLHADAAEGCPHWRGAAGAAAAHSSRPPTPPLPSRPPSLQYKVKDMSQADFGRLEIELAEAEMPGLMACRTE